MGRNTFANLTDLRMADIISAEINLLLKDSTNLLNTPFMQYAGSINNSGTTTIKIRKAGLMGYDLFETPTNEDDSVASTSITDSHVDVQAVRMALNYELSDLANMTSFGQDIDPMTLARSISESYEATVADKVAGLFSSFTASKGTAGSTFALDDFFDAIYVLETAANAASLKVGAAGPFVCVLAPKQLTELQNSLRSEQSNIIAFSPANAEMLEAKGSQYAGSLFGVELYKSAYVEAASSVLTGAMWAAGAIAYCDGVPNIVHGGNDIMPMGKIVVEMERNALRAITSIVGHAYYGTSILSDEKGVKLTTVA
tara:strand:- start:238 stop:1176 length:939 start_codon:yes stop_codon:yes gene_type:complete